MAIDLKGIFKKDEETLVVDRRGQAIKLLIILAAMLFLMIVVILIVRKTGDVDEIRRANITKDVQNIRSYAQNKANEVKANSDVVLPGTDLQSTPIQIDINGIVEEYRYGYYLLNSQDIVDMTTALNVQGEQYIVNYDTYDVINVAGVKYKGKVYHSIDDLVAIENGTIIPSTITIIIKVPADMEKLRQYPNANFKLAGNIDMQYYTDLNPQGWTPVPEFSGKLDGRGYTISNLKIEKTSDRRVGLFGNITSAATVTNVTFENANVAGEDYTGILAGASAGNISRVMIKGGTVTGTECVGGLVGSHQTGRISNCKIDLNSIGGNSQIGGAIGVLNSGTAETIKVTCGTLNAIDSGGGLVGNIAATSSTYLMESTSNATILGSNNLGGLVGKIEILQRNSLQIENCYAKGTIAEGQTNMGGLVGFIRTATAEISLKDLYAAVSLLVKNETSGGCVGATNISIQSSPTVVEVFWEKNLAVGEVLNDVGSSATSTVLNFRAKTAEDMRYRLTFVNWDFTNIWGIDERVNTPYLKFENQFKEYSIDEEKK